MEQTPDNPLLSSKPSDSGVTVALHPLVLLTASDQITRSRVRGDKQPVVGVLLGQQRGREITVEHAFAAALAPDNAGFDGEWLDTRVTQYRDVHKAPALDVVGWFALAPESGPLPELVPFQRHITSVYNDSAVFLAIHPTAFQQSSSTDRTLPLTVYESIQESENAKDESSMQVDGDDSSGLLFRTIPFTVETDEAEMIAINFVSKGAGSAASITDATSASKSDPAAEDKKGKKRATRSDTATKPTSQSTLQSALTSEEQDQIATLTTRLNSVKMLQSRLSLLNTFVRDLPPSYLSDPTLPITPESPSPDSLPHLRNLQSLLTTLSLLTPSSTSTETTTETANSAQQDARSAQRNDVLLSQLLNSLTKDVQGLQELGRTFQVVESGRATSKRNKGQSGSFMDDMLHDPMSVR
ncbi:COP9 signalosome complex subunit 6 [Cyphellophora attinorum]|uniref:COP9 signalosome complex subunit 6 n=1 Tax=Cyphellophora attinorum TaxID=1664694 RepID=A0A0N0NJI7_9EURO|nr:COP9 signalosome complex subunit 6 [Phialophora attinorum]KPI36948.1 COP9 signalosome complex subunit 6 [Phialophora attinorum]